jgi:hypothetical protein
MFNSEKTQVKEIGKRMKDQEKKNLLFKTPLEIYKYFVMNIQVLLMMKILSKIQKNQQNQKSLENDISLRQGVV